MKTLEFIFIISNRTPDYFKTYNSSVNPIERIDIVIDWIENKNVDFAMVYIDQSDKSGHEYSAFSLEVEKSVKAADATLKYLNIKLDLLKKQHNFDINLIVLADHGMVNVTETQIFLDNYVDLKNVVFLVSQTGPLSGIIPDGNKSSQVYHKLKDAHPNMTVYLKDQIPERFHYKNNRRITPIIALADEGYMIFEVIFKILIYLLFF